MIRKFTNEELYNLPWRPSDDQVLAAARILDRELRFHGHLDQGPTYEEMITCDPIGASEWGGMIERMLMAAHLASNNE